MNEIYNQEYYENYDISLESPVNYKESKHLQNFFKHLAKTVVEKYNPKTVLDAGCALGLFVKELRNLGVEAYGIDISEYAIENVDESIKSYCAVCSLTDKIPESLPQKYDIVTCIEVMEHLNEADGIKAISNLCMYSDRILFSSTSTDFEDSTHINVRNADFWAEQFAKNGFYNDVTDYPNFISADSYAFVKMKEASFAVALYERKIFELKSTITEEQEQIQSIKNENNSLKEQNQTLVKENEHLNYTVEKNSERINDLERKIAVLNEEKSKLTDHYFAISRCYNEILNSQYWKITKPFRKITNKIKQILRKHKITRYPCKALKVLIKQGPKETISKIKGHFYIQKSADYSYITKKCRIEEENYKFDRDIKFSILVPLYNTPIKFLDEMIESVKAQTYKNWELCLADGSDEEHSDVRGRVESHMQKDKRIIYRKLEKNLGISENTNACIEMSTGDYIALFDHDDILHPSALFENMKAICEQGADFIYTDEAVFASPDICKIITFHFKPDYAIDNLRANNYICHFSVFSRELLEKTGGFRREYDGSQDHDLVLRLTSNAKKVYHIQKLLYFWRSHPQSVAMSIGAKEYAIIAGRRAVHDNIKASGYDCTVESSKVCPTIYRIRYELKIHPFVSIVIPNKDHKDDLKRCIDSIMFRSTYDNYEIIVIENNSKDKEIFDYYEEIEKENNIRVVKYDGKFNYSDINNYGASYAGGEYLILLNNDTEVITPEWIEEMLMYAQRPDVGIVGAKLYYPDDTVQHAGVVLGLGSCNIAGHAHIHISKDNPGYIGKAWYSQDVSAVTAACLMIKKSIFDSIGGFDCELAVAFNDVDLCLRIGQKGLLVVMTPYAELYHYESKSRGSDSVPEKSERFMREVRLFKKKWGDKILKTGDPFYNPNLSLAADYDILYDKINQDKRY